MIKFKKGNTIVLGLSDENISRLKDGQPIKFNLSELGLPDNTVIIFNGKTEDEMYKVIKDQIDISKTIFKSSREKEN